MRASLYILSGIPERTVTPLNEGSYVLGRGSQAEIQIPSREISRKHAQIHVSKSEILLQDCGSANGTLLNGRRIVKEPLKDGDQITIGNVTLAIRFEGFESAPPPKKQAFPPQSTIVQAVTKVVSQNLKPKQLWPFFSLIFGAGFIALSIFGGLSFKSLLQQKLKMETLGRAQGLVKYLAEKNREDVKLGHELLLDVDTILRERGVVKAFIINEKGRIIAPTENSNESHSDAFVLEAMAHDSDQAMLPSPKLPNGNRIFVHPIRDFDEKKGNYVNIGVAKIIFSPERAVGQLQETDRLIIVLLILSVLFATLLGWVASNIFTKPLQSFAERVQAWRTGDAFRHEKPPFEEFKPLYEAVERAIEDVDR